MKIGSSQLSPGVSTQLGGSAGWVGKAGGPHPLAVLLFGKRPPRLVDRRRHPKLKRALRKLEYLKDQVAPLAGRDGGALSVELCEGENASISRSGQLAVGIELLEQHQHDDDLLVAIVGHEIGHRPWTWPDGDLGRLSRAQLDQLYREEEAKADRFAGRVLADLGGSPESICRFLLAAAKFEAHPPSDYYPAKVRAAMIRSAFTRRARVLASASRNLPELARKGRDLR